MASVGPAKRKQPIRIIHNQIFNSLSLRIPRLTPDTADIVAIADTTKIIPNLNKGVTSILKRYSKPLAICEAPRPKVTAIPNKVLKTANKSMKSPVNQ